MTSDDVLTLEESAELVKVSPQIMRRAFASGHIKGGKGPASIGFRATRSSVLAWVDAGMPGIEKTRTVDDDEEGEA